MNTPKSRTLTAAETEAFGNELDALRQEVVDDLGQRDVDYIRGVLKAMRYNEIAGRLLLQVSFTPLGITAGIACLSLSKILENMEVAHNVMHGQYDWTNDPELDSRLYEWDIVCSSASWRHYHNYEHHTYTNILGKDRDFGYTILRLSPEQPWKPIYLLQPVYTVIHALNFEWGIGAFGLEFDKLLSGEKTKTAFLHDLRDFVGKASRQIGKDYVVFPLLAGIGAPKVFLGNLAANTVRNLWTYSIIFCGHFTEDVQVFQEADTRNETRGQWYLRQLKGSSNIEGHRWLHVLSGHLSYQIEHHLFPDLPAQRYEELGPKVQAICEKYGQHYNTGSFAKQLGGVMKRILKHSLPTKTESGEEQAVPLSILKVPVSLSSVKRLVGSKILKRDEALALSA